MGCDQFISGAFVQRPKHSRFIQTAIACHLWRSIILTQTWNVREFVRGTLRLNGWADAWADVFSEIETLSGDAGDARLKEMSDQFWAENAYGEDDPDRVVLCVSLKAERDDQTVWHQTYAMDAWGTDASTAMARLVSKPVSFGIKAVLNNQIPAGDYRCP